MSSKGDSSVNSTAYKHREEDAAIADLAQAVMKQLNSEMQKALLNHQPSWKLHELEKYAEALSKSSMITLQESEQSGTVPMLFKAEGSDAASLSGAADSNEQMNQPVLDMTEGSDMASPLGAADSDASLPGADLQMTDVCGDVASPLGVTDSCESASQQTVQSTSVNASDFSDVRHSEQHVETPAYLTQKLSPEESWVTQM